MSTHNDEHRGHQSSAADTSLPPSAPSRVVKVDEYIIGRELGRGSFAKVYHAVSERTGAASAVKKIDRTRLSSKLLQNLESEISILRDFQHVNIVCLEGIRKTSSHIYLVLEFCAGGDLHKYIRSKGRLSERVASHFMRHLAFGLEFLWRRQLIHRDIKPQNLLLTAASDSATLKIADFGFARSLGAGKMADTMCGSPLYMAPEILSGQKYDAKADLWSAGTVLFEMLAGQPPYGGSTQHELMDNIRRKELRLPRGVNIAPPCVTLIQMLLKRMPEKRASFEMFLSAEFLKPQNQIASPVAATNSSPSPVASTTDSHHAASSHNSAGSRKSSPSSEGGNSRAMVAESPPSLPSTPVPLSKHLTSNAPAASTTPRVSGSYAERRSGFQSAERRSGFQSPERRSVFQSADDGGRIKAVPSHVRPSSETQIMAPQQEKQQHQRTLGGSTHSSAYDSAAGTMVVSTSTHSRGSATSTLSLGAAHQHQSKTEDDLPLHTETTHHRQSPPTYTPTKGLVQGTGGRFGLPGGLTQVYGNYGGTGGTVNGLRSALTVPMRRPPMSQMEPLTSSPPVASAFAAYAAGMQEQEEGQAGEVGAQHELSSPSSPQSPSRAEPPPFLAPPSSHTEAALLGHGRHKGGAFTPFKDEPQAAHNTSHERMQSEGSRAHHADFSHRPGTAGGEGQAGAGSSSSWTSGKAMDGSDVSTGSDGEWCYIDDMGGSGGRLPTSQEAPYQKNSRQPTSVLPPRIPSSSSSFHHPPAVDVGRLVGMVQQTERLGRCGMAVARLADSIAATAVAVSRRNSDSARRRYSAGDAILGQGSGHQEHEVDYETHTGEPSDSTQQTQDVSTRTTETSDDGASKCGQHRGDLRPSEGQALFVAEGSPGDAPQIGTAGDAVSGLGAGGGSMASPSRGSGGAAAATPMHTPPGSGSSPGPHGLPEALVLYLKAMGIMRRAVELGREVLGQLPSPQLGHRKQQFGQKTQEYGQQPSPQLGTYAWVQQVGARAHQLLQWISNQFTLLLERAEQCRLSQPSAPKNISPTSSRGRSVSGDDCKDDSALQVPVSPVAAEEVMYVSALQLARSAAVKEVLGQSTAGLKLYQHGQLVVEALLLQPGLPDSDQKVLQSYHHGFEMRIRDLQAESNIREKDVVS